MKDLGMNDSMTSYACGKGVKADFCNNDRNDDCYNGNGTHVAGPSKSPDVGRGDKMTTAKLYCHDYENYHAAMAFRDSNCKSDMMRIDIGKNRSTYYNKNDLNWRGMGSDNISSVMVPAGYELHLFDDDGLQGKREVYSGREYDYDGMMVC
jgi:hypothetical protein